MELTMETIDPKKAQEYLATGVNRPLRKRKVEALAAEMKRGEWEEESAEPIKFNKEGQLFDGQHRLNALVESNSTLRFAVARNVPNNAFSKLDSGLKRTGGDTLYMEGAKNWDVIAGVIRKYLMLKKKIGFSKIGGHQHTQITNNDLLKEYKRRKKWWDETGTQTYTWYDGIIKAMTPSDVGGFFAYFHDKDAEDARRFFEKVASGAGLHERSPILKLRQMLLRWKQDPYSQVSSIQRSAIIIKAWNMYRNRETVEGNIKYNSGKEDFPTPV